MTATAPTSEISVEPTGFGPVIACVKGMDTPAIISGHQQAFPSMMILNDCAIHTDIVMSDNKCIHHVDAANPVVLICNMTVLTCILNKVVSSLVAIHHEYALRSVDLVDCIRFTDCMDSCQINKHHSKILLFLRMCPQFTQFL